MSDRTRFWNDLLPYKRLAKQQNWDIPDKPGGGGHWVWVNPAMAPPAGRVVIGGSGKARGLANTIAQLKKAGLVIEEKHAGRKTKSQSSGVRSGAAGHDGAGGS